MSRWEWVLHAFRALPRKALVPALALAQAVLIASGWWLGHRSLRPPTIGPLPGQHQEARASQIPPTRKPQVKTIAVVLTPGLVRGSEESRPVVIPPDVSLVRLEARFEGNYPRYQATLATVEGRQVWSEGSLQAQATPTGKRVFLDLSSSLLAPGDYILTVRGLPAAGNAETLAEYTFRVQKR